MLYFLIGNHVYVQNQRATDRFTSDRVHHIGEIRTILEEKRNKTQ